MTLMISQKAAAQQVINMMCMKKSQETLLDLSLIHI